MNKIGLEVRREGERHIVKCGNVEEMFKKDDLSLLVSLLKIYEMSIEKERCPSVLRCPEYKRHIACFDSKIGCFARGTYFNGKKVTREMIDAFEKLNTRGLVR